MAHQFTNRFVAINSTSTSTSSPFLAADFRVVTVSWQSSASLGPSRVTIEGSNADGLTASDLGGSTSETNWSLVTGINLIGRNTGIAQLDSGLRWYRATVAPANHSSASATSVVFNGQSW